MSANSATSAAQIGISLARTRGSVESEEAWVRPEPRAFSMARVSLVIALFAAPLAFGAVETWAWATLTVIAAALLTLWAVGNVRQGAFNLYWSSLYIPAALFLLLGITQWAGRLTAEPFATQVALIKLTTDAIFFFLAGQLWVGATATAWKHFGLVTTLYVLWMSLFAVAQLFSGRGLIYWKVSTPGSDPVGPYVNHNHYAGLMEMVIPIAISFALFCVRESLAKIVAMLAVILGLASVLLTQSRGGVIAVAGELVAWIVVLKRYRASQGIRGRGALWIGLAAGIGVIFLLVPASSWRRIASVEGLAQKPGVTLEDRLQVSRDALGILKNDLWVGSGLGTFETVFPRYRRFATDLVWTHAHDDYVEALTETGVLGGLLVLWALYLFLRSLFRRAQDRLRHPVEWIQIGAAIGCCGLLIHSLVDFNLHIPANAAWFAALAGMSIVERKTRAIHHLREAGKTL